MNNQFPNDDQETAALDLWSLLQAKTAAACTSGKPLLRHDAPDATRELETGAVALTIEHSPDSAVKQVSIVGRCNGTEAVDQIALFQCH